MLERIETSRLLLMRLDRGWMERFSQNPREAAQALAKATRSEVVQVIGTKFVLYRPSHKAGKQDKIVLVRDKKRS